MDESGAVLFFLIIVASIFGWLGVIVAENKGYDKTAGFLWGFFLGPIGLVIVALLGPDSAQRPEGLASLSANNDVLGIHSFSKDQLDLAYAPYRRWLVDHYKIERNEILGEFFCGEQAFETIEHALDFAHGQALEARTKHDEEEAKLALQEEERVKRLALQEEERVKRLALQEEERIKRLALNAELRRKRMGRLRTRIIRFLPGLAVTAAGFVVAIALFSNAAEKQREAELERKRAELNELQIECGNLRRAYSDDFQSDGRSTTELRESVLDCTRRERAISDRILELQN